MSTAVHVEEGRWVVTLDELPDEAFCAFLAGQLQEAAEEGPIVIDVSGLIIRPDDVRALQSLILGLTGRTVWLACSRLSGRRLLNHLLPNPPPVVDSIDQAPPWP